jgi:hypothetical protein
MIDQNLDRPEESGAADVTLVSRGITVPVCVEVSETGVVVVRPSGDGPPDRDTIELGDAVELYWVGGHEERTSRASSPASRSVPSRAGTCP